MASLEHAIFTYDIQVICIDNLQFMLSNQGEGYMKFDLQDRVISGLRRLATDLDVHVFLIIHPKKVEDDNNLQVSSIFGSAKSTQEADSVMILQKHEDMPNVRTIQVKKNRYDGELGSQHMAFYPENKRYIEISPFEFNIFKDGHGSVDTLIEHRRKKNDGEIEPELEEMARENPRGNFQPVRGYVSKAAELISEGL